MKFSVKTLLATTALAVLVATPVLATEKNMTAELNAIDQHAKAVGGQISSYLTTDDGCNAAAKADHAQHAKTVDAQLQYVVTQEQQNYINYLKSCLWNAKNDEAAAKQMVTSLTDVVKANPGFQKQLDDAVAFYNQKVAARVSAEQAITDAQATFKAANLQLNEIVAGGIAHNTAIDK